MRKQSKRRSSNKAFEDAHKNEEIKQLKLQLAKEKRIAKDREKEILEMKVEIDELEEKKEFERQKKKDIQRIEKKIARVEKKMKKINKEAIWEWKESKGVWRVYSTETIKKVEKLKIGETFEYTLQANNQTYQITKWSKTKGEQVKMY